LNKEKEEMILVVGGTGEGEKAAQFLRKKGFNQNQAAGFKTSYGEDVLKGVVFLSRNLNCPMTMHLIRKYKIQVLVDATPIYFKGASLKIMSACRMTGVRYIRFEPPALRLNEGKGILKVRNLEEASEKAMGFGKTVFLNIGNNNINLFTKKGAKRNKRIVIRVSERGALSNSLNFGIKRHDILLIDGAFSEAFNHGLIKEYDISVFVTRDLGEGNGIAEEVKAASSENVPVVLIERPRLSYKELITDCNKLSQAISWINRRGNGRNSKSA